MEKKRELDVYNACQGKLKNITINELLVIGRKLVDEYPVKNQLWYPSGTVTSVKLFYWILFILFQVLPAILVDSALRISGRKPM